MSGKTVLRIAFHNKNAIFDAILKKHGKTFNLNQDFVNFHQKIWDNGRKEMEKHIQSVSVFIVKYNKSEWHISKKN